MLARSARSLLRLGSVGIAIYASRGLQISSSTTTNMRISLIQLLSTADKTQNIIHAQNMIHRAVEEHQSNLIVLPECWNSPYSTASFPIYAEEVPGDGVIVDEVAHPSTHMLITIARKLGVWIVGGSFPERDSSSGIDKLYNTCQVIDPTGMVVARHRKVHLFDIDVPGKIAFKESDSLSAGDAITTVNTPWGMLGVGICYDIRFPELALLMRQRGCKMLVYPGAFNMVTGPAHWELLQRARAVDNQLFVAACSPARIEGSGYVAWGHSSVISPWGEVIATANAEETIVHAVLDMTQVDTMRQNIPCWSQKRSDMYEVITKKVTKDASTTRDASS